MPGNQHITGKKYCAQINKASYFHIIISHFMTILMTRSVIMTWSWGHDEATFNTMIRLKMRNHYKSTFTKVCCKLDNLDLKDCSNLNLWQIGVWKILGSQHETIFLFEIMKTSKWCSTIFSIYKTLQLLHFPVCQFLKLSVRQLRQRQRWPEDRGSIEKRWIFWQKLGR